MPPRDPASTLARDLADVARHAPGKISVVVRDAGGVVAQVDGERVVDAGGLQALLLLVALLDEVAERRLALDDVVALPAQRGAGVLAHLPGVEELTLDEVARLMVVAGDESAAAAVADAVGAPVVAQVAARVGIDREDPATTSAQDLAALLAVLREGDLLPFAQVRYAFDLLRGQQHAVGVAALLPEGVFHASLPGRAPGARHDCAVIETGEGVWASVAVLATGMHDSRYGQDYSVSVLPGFNAIGEAVLAYLQASTAETQE